MKRRIYLIFFVLVLIGGIIFIIFRNLSNRQVEQKIPLQTSLPAVSPFPIIPPDNSYKVEDNSVTPNTKNSIVQAEILRETAVHNGHTWQKIMLRSPNDGSLRELYNKSSDNLQFERIRPENWSAHNRYLYLIFNNAGKRDIIFFQIDGRFTNKEYYIQPLEAYPDLTVINARWEDYDTFSLETMNLKTARKQNYLVDFNDSVGTLVPIDIGN